MTEPRTPALDEWYETRYQGRPDRPTVRIWYPTDAPTARLATITVGGSGSPCGGEDVLPRGTIHAHLTVGGVEFGGPLDDLELLIRACGELLAVCREQADEMKREEDPS